MEQLRKFVTDALKLRANKGIKVRQPLRCLTLSDASFQNKKELLTILKDEINVKEIDFGDSFLLDTVITPELREEGLVREIIRNIQEMRKELGLGHREEIKFQLCGNERIMNIIRRWESRLKKDAGARVFLYGGKKIFRGERELLLDQENLWMGIS